MSNQILKIKVPPPEIGQNRARVSVVNNCGESVEEVDYVYLEACEFPEIPEETDLGGIDDNELVNAYEECLEEIADLFCDVSTATPPLETPTTPTPVTRLQIDNFRIPQINNLFAGAVFSFGFELFGTGNCTYQIVLEAGGNSYPITSGNFTEFLDVYPGDRSSRTNPRDIVGTLDRVVVPSGFFEVPRDIISDSGVFALRVTNSNNTSVVEILQVQFNIAPPAQSAPVLQTDNDPTNSNKEIYYISNTVADISNTYDSYRQDVADRRVDGEYITGDLFRQNNGSFWIKQSADSERLVLPRKQPGQLPFITNSFRVKSIQPFSVQGFAVANNESYQITTSPIRGRQGSVQSVDFGNLIRGPFFDFSYVYQKPYTPKELSEISNPINSLVLDVNNYYNYYLKQYEEIQVNVDEALLPNLYYMELNSDFVDTTEQQVVTNEATVQQQEFLFDPDIPKLLTLNPQAENNPSQIDSYYDLFVERVQQDNFDDNELLQRARSVVVPYKFIDKVLEKSEQLVLYPMSVDIKFDGTANRQFGPLLKNSIYGEQIYLNCISKFQQNQSTLNFVKEEFGENNSLFTSQNRFLNFQEIFDGVENINDNFVYLGNYNDFNVISGDQYQKQNEKLLLTTTIKSRVKNLFRTYKDIFDGKKCYTETLFYKISKFGSDLETPLQEFYIPNDPDKKNFRFVDTQVKYNKKYTYRIYSYDIVVGNSYLPLGNDPTKLLNRSEIYIIENIYDQFEQTVRDAPPTAPHIDIIPYKDVDNKLLLLLNKDNMSYTQKEVVIEESDTEFFNTVRDSQGLDSDQNIEFSGDDIIKKYQLYKTTVPPKSYRDFSNAEKIEISTTRGTSGTETRISAVSFVDSIQPNRKYYYTTRCVDIHDQISNPTPVYEVEMINESGTIFPIINLWDFPVEKPRDATKSLKRFLMIRPSLLNRQLNYDTVGVNDLETLKANTTIGVQDEMPWAKTYKLRMVSKNTGKIYDIKFGFDIKKENITN